VLTDRQTNKQSQTDITENNTILATACCVGAKYSKYMSVCD